MANKWSNLLDAILTSILTGFVKNSVQCDLNFKSQAKCCNVQRDLCPDQVRSGLQHYCPFKDRLPDCLWSSLSASIPQYLILRDNKVLRLQLLLSASITSRWWGRASATYHVTAGCDWRTNLSEKSAEKSARAAITQISTWIPPSWPNKAGRDNRRLVL